MSHPCSTTCLRTLRYGTVLNYKQNFIFRPLSTGNPNDPNDIKTTKIAAAGPGPIMIPPNSDITTLVKNLSNVGDLVMVLSQYAEKLFA